MRSRSTILASALALVAALAGAVAPAGARSGGDVREIIGGEIATPGAYPWMAALVDARLAAEDGQFCGGTLVRPRVVLTASHCVAGLRPRDFDVVIGREQLSSREGVRLDVERVAGHPRSGIGLGASGMIRNDVAQVKLREAPGVATLPLADPDGALLFGVGAPSKALGWGLVREGGVETSNEMREVDVLIVSDEVCAEAYPGFTGSNQICAAAPDRDACQGDSGGPLIVSDGLGGWAQVGVVSGGRGCARAKYPGVYAKVPSLVDFIENLHPTFAPYNTSRPRMRGRAQVGQRLRCMRGEWTGGKINASFLWALVRRGRPTRIVGIGWFWRATPRYAGRRVTCTVIGSNEGGYSTAEARPRWIRR